MNELRLKMPIKIKPTINNDGYIITDANNTDYFFYEKDGELESNENYIQHECIVCQKKIEEDERQKIISLGCVQTWCLICIENREKRISETCKSEKN